MTVPGPPLAPELLLDPLTRYLFDHYHRFLTRQEAAVVRYRLLRAKRIGFDTGQVSPHPQDRRILELEQAFPEQFARIRTQGLAVMIAGIRDRLMRDHASQIPLNCCPGCGALCRTPRAQQCFDCGHDWHK